MAATKAALEDLDSYEATYRQGVQEGKLAQCQATEGYFAEWRKRFSEAILGCGAILALNSLL